MMRKIFKDIGSVFINGNYFDVDEEKEVVTPFKDLFDQSKRLPEVVINLEVSEKEFMNRKFDRQKVVDEHNAVIKKLKE